MATWKIKDLKGVGDVELELDDSKRVFVFLGSNGVGKTKTLEALLLFYLVKNKNFNSEIHIPQPILKQIVHDADSIIVNNTGGYHWKSLKEQVEEQDFGFAYIGAGHRSSIAEPTKNIQKIGTLKDRQKNYFKKIAKSFVAFNQKDLGGLSFLNDWFIARAQSVSIYQKESENFKLEIDTVLKALHSIDNRIDEKLQIDAGGNVFLTIEGQEHKLTELSSGFASLLKIVQSIVSAYALFSSESNLLNVKGYVLIDEIGSHLHIDWQSKIVNTLKNLFPNTTFYIATHSPLVLSQLSQGEAYLLKRHDDGVVRSEEIKSPNKRIFSSVLQDGFDIDLNKLKRENMVNSDQSQAKKRLLELLHETQSRQGNLSD